MKKHKVFIDGAVGTTGLRIHERLAGQADIELLALPDAERKNLAARVEMVSQADVSVLCLPDDAAREIAEAAPETARICDASTAHRTAPGWVYGFPELDSRRSRLATANRVAVPGCYPSGFLAFAAPLVEKGAVDPAHAFSVFALTGYSGGGKGMIAAYGDPARPTGYSAPRVYGLSMHHKHRPEMQAIAGLSTPPLFVPVLGDYYAGMAVSVPLPKQAVAPAFATQDALAALLAEYYADSKVVKVHPAGAALPDGTIAANTLAGKDALELFVLGGDDQLLLCALYDNLGKGASGAAVQCLNLMLGREETAGLVL